MLGNKWVKKFCTGVVYTTLCVSLCFASGCGKSAAEDGLETYKASMTEFYDKLAYYDQSINGIDPNSENAKSQLLAYLDEMNESYKTMAELEIPEEFDGISEIAVEAADYMQMADEFYHLAYDGVFDEDNEQLAAQYYQRANSRVQGMLTVLHGEIPEGEGITVTTENSEDTENTENSENSEAVETAENAGN
jgi:hypothetical protein